MLQDEVRADKRGWRAIDFLEHTCCHTDNLYLKRFDSDFFKRLRQPEFKNLHNSSHLKKEITESQAVLHAVERLMADKRFGEGGIAPADVIFFDVCSGKGFNSLLLSFRYPTSSIVMIDNDTSIKFPHLSTLTNTSFVLCDIRTNSFESLIESRVRNSGKQYPILIGMHLCGPLASRLIQLFDQYTFLAGLVLSPCCLPRRNEKTVKNLRPLAKKLKQNEYTVWSLWLYHLLCNKPKDMFVDDAMMCDKNVLISSLRTTPSPLPPLPEPLVLSQPDCHLLEPSEELLRLCTHEVHQCSKEGCSCIVYPSSCTYCKHFLAHHARVCKGCGMRLCRRCVVDGGCRQMMSVGKERNNDE